MSDGEPRYELRVWGENLAEFRERLERRATPVKVVSRETYLISRATDSSNAKIRNSLLDVKALIAEYEGLQQWKPALKAAFPLDRSVIATELFPLLGTQPPPLPKPRYELTEFLDEVAGAASAIKIVEISKTRSKFSFDNYQAEFTVVLLEGVARETAAIESTDALEVLRLKYELGFDGAENVSYVRFVKRMLGLQQN